MTPVDDYCRKWNLNSPQLLASTFTSDVYKVIRQSGESAALKILNAHGKDSEGNGAAVLRCFAGKGTVHLIEADDGAHLLEYISGPSLRTVVENGNDHQATEVICDAITQLHSYQGQAPRDVFSMERNFRSLFQKAEKEPADSFYREGAVMARELISSPMDIRLLHGDIHHENILESSERGWLLIDPKCLIGERTYDCANVFYNPNGFSPVASPDVIRYRCAIFSKRLKLDRLRVLEYAFAYGCLSAAWNIEDGQSEVETLRIARSIHEMIKRHAYRDT